MRTLDFANLDDTGVCCRFDLLPIAADGSDGEEKGGVWWGREDADSAQVMAVRGWRRAFECRNAWPAFKKWEAVCARCFAFRWKRLLRLQPFQDLEPASWNENQTSSRVPKSDANPDRSEAMKSVSLEPPA